MAVRKLLRMQESDIYRKGIFINPRTNLDQHIIVLGNYAVMINH
jgi:hypothetical protein